MDYSKVIELDNVTIDDCMRFYRRSGLVAILNDGKLVNFEKEIESC